MAPNDLFGLLRANQYPGRGIIAGCGASGRQSVIAYFIMGRSENSRNRVFTLTDDGFRTEAFDPARLADPSLVIYNPMRVRGGVTILTNGDQTDTILKYLEDGRDYRDALLTREFEPDLPIYTPRISALIRRDGSYSMSILKSAGGDPACCCRYFFDYSSVVPGLGRFISTYMNDGDPPPSFEGEPLSVGVDLTGGLEAFAGRVWDSLNEANRVSLYARVADLSTGAASALIINKNER